MPASGRALSARRVLDNSNAVSYETDEHYAISAYAPIDPRGPSAVLSGRGLY
jgi:rare lipoprotein A